MKKLTIACVLSLLMAASAIAQTGSPPSKGTRNPFTQTSGSVALPFIVATDAPYNCRGDGVSDDTACMQAAINAAAGKTLVIPWTASGYKITATLFVHNACKITGFGPTGSTAPYLTEILHAFNGDFIVIDGSGGINTGAGTTIEGLSLVQAFGTNTNPAGVGAAIKLTVTDASHRATWTKIRNINIETNPLPIDPWTWGIQLVGNGAFPISSGDVRDTIVENVRILSDGSAGGAIQSVFATGLWLDKVNVNTNIGGSPVLQISGYDASHPTTGVHITDSTISNLAMVYASNVFMNAGKVTGTVTVDANAVNNVLRPSMITGSIANNSTTTIVSYWDGATYQVGGPIQTSGTFVNGTLRMTGTQPSVVNGVNAAIPTASTNVLFITTPTGAFSLDGLVAPSNFTPIFIINASGQTMTIKNQSVSASAANRILTGTGADIAGALGVILVYSTNATPFWFVVAKW